MWKTIIYIAFCISITGCEKKYDSPIYSLGYNISTSNGAAWSGTLKNSAGETLKYYNNQGSGVQDVVSIKEGDQMHVDLYSVNSDSAAYILMKVEYTGNNIIRNFNIYGYHWKGSTFVKDTSFLSQPVKVD